MNKVLLPLKTTYLLILTVFMYPLTALAGEGEIMTYFINHVIIRVIIGGGFYSLGIFALIFLISWRNEKFRIIFLSVLIAFCALLLLIFAFEAISNVSLIPSP